MKSGFSLPCLHVDVKRECLGIEVMTTIEGQSDCCLKAQAGSSFEVNGLSNWNWRILLIIFSENIWKIKFR